MNKLFMTVIVALCGFAYAAAEQGKEAKAPAGGTPAAQVSAPADSDGMVYEENEQESKPQPAPAASPAAEPKGEFKPIEPEKFEVSEQMPQDMTWGVPSSSSERLPADWKADGKVLYTSLDDKEDEMAALGDTVELKMKSSMPLKPGDYMKVYRIYVPEKDSSGKVKFIRAQQSALLKVSKVDGKKVLAEVVRVFNPVEKGDSVKKM